MDEPSVLAYFWTRTLFVCGLLGAGGILLALGRSHAPRLASRLLVVMAILFSVGVGTPRWLPNPNVDYMIPITPFSILSVVVGLLVGLVCKRLWRRQGLFVALITSGAASLLYALLTDLEVLSMEGQHGTGRGLYVLPAAIAGALLAWLATSHQRDRAFYVVGWVAVTAMWLLSHYAAEVAALENAYWYASFQANDPTLKAARLAQVGLGQVVATVVYVAGSLLLLALPFVSKERTGSRAGEIEHSTRAVTVGS